MSYELRPLTLAEILDAAFRLVQTEWRTLVGLSLVMQVPIVLAATQATWIFDPFAQPFGADQEPSPEMLMELLVTGGGMGLAYLILYPFVAGAVTASVGNFYLGRAFTFGDAARAGLSVLLKLVLAYIVYVFALMLMLLIPAAAIGVVIAMVLPALEGLGAAGTVIGVAVTVVLILFGLFWYLFAACLSTLLAPVIVLESKGVFGGVARAFRLGSTAKARLIGVVVTAGLIVGFPVFGAQMMIGFVPYVGLLVWALFQAIGFAFTSSVAVVLYFDLRCRAENYDLELLAEQVEAGPGFGQ
jgi:hypothetical protein